jgi:hypothetical protein
MIAKREMEDAEMKRYVEIRKNEKREQELEKKKMLEQLARDKEERFGKKFDPLTQSEIKKEYSPFDDAQYYLRAIKTSFPTFRAGDTTKNCYNTIKVILSNIVKNQSEEKFRKVKTTNPNFQERVGKIKIALKVLEILQFKEEGEFLICSNPDFGLFEKIISFLEEEINKLD